MLLLLMPCRFGAGESTIDAAELGTPRWSRAKDGGVELWRAEDGDAVSLKACCCKMAAEVPGPQLLPT